MQCFQSSVKEKEKEYKAVVIRGRVADSAGSTAIPAWELVGAQDTQKFPPKYNSVDHFLSSSGPQVRPWYNHLRHATADS